MSYLPPETVELNKKLGELNALEHRLVERELELSTLESELAAFHARCVRTLGGLFAELDELRARLASERARRRPADQGAERAADEARIRAFDTAQQAAYFAAMPETPEFDPPADIKQLYREAARRIHPDRAADDEDRARRTDLMSRANRAYRAGDRADLQAILEECSSDPDMVPGDDVPAALVRAIRRIARINARLEEIEGRIALLVASDIYKLMRRVRCDSEAGRDPFAGLTATLNEEIDAARRRLAQLDGSIPAPIEPLHVPPQAPAMVEEAPFDQPERTHPTSRGELVRYAAEAAIAEILHDMGLDYRYEQPIVGSVAPGIRRPSFALKDRQGRWTIWQYFPAGELDEVAEQRRDWFERNGYIPGMNFFLTRDAGGGPDAAEVRQIAAYLKALL